MNLLREFKKFILRGNVVDLAIAVALGAAFTAVITSFVTNIIMPLIAIPGDKASFGQYYVTIAGSQFRYGLFIDAVITFLIIAAVIFFFVVLPINRLMARRKTEPDVESETRDCPECLSAVPKAATRCAFCTAQITPVSGASTVA